jgi:hypothetical protein
MAFLAAMFGLPLSEAQAEVFRARTGRARVPEGGFNEAWLVCGKRAGKSFILAVIAVYLACFRDYRKHLGPGERGTVMVIATDRRQARVIFRYIRGMLKASPMLWRMVDRELSDQIDLENAVTIEVQTASFKTTRGYTIVAALCDELAFWPYGDDAAAPDYAILDAIRPGMGTIPNAMLLCASSPYAQRGALYDAFRRWHGREDAPALVWRAATREMNPTFPQRTIDEAMGRDPASGAAEYLAEFRTDVEAYVSREAVEACVSVGVIERPPITGEVYFGFVDPSGGASDSMTLSIAHPDRRAGHEVLDCSRERRAPFSPQAVVEEFAAVAKSYRIARLVGDRWGGEFVREPFRAYGIDYQISDKPKSDIYRDLLPALNSRRIELLDLPRLTAQLCGLERRVARGGRDSIDHQPGAHDDVANSAAGALLLAAGRPSAVVIPKAAMIRARMPGRFADRFGVRRFG